MTEWIVRRWTRYGHKRLYAATPGGTDLGSFDLATGRYHSDDLSNLPLLRRAIEDHMGVHQPAAPAAPAADPPPATPSSIAHPAASPTMPPTAHQAASAAATPASPRAGVSAASPAPPPPLRDWHDLADVRAGVAARARAIEERQKQGAVRHFFARLRGAKTDERSWRVGADGEEAVGERLATLGTPWRVLHAVRVGDRGADIDHVVIGPGGVFTINAKHHPRASVWVGGDTVMVNGRREPYVRNSRFEARRTSRLLSEHVGFPVPVTGLIAVVGARGGFTVKAQPADGAVAVVARRDIATFLRRWPRRLDLRQIDAIHEVARRSTTWQG